MSEHVFVEGERVKIVRTRAEVERLFEAGRTQAEIARELGITKATVAYHARRIGLPPDERFNRRYDWAAVQRYYDEGHSVRDCIAHFGFSSASWFDAAKRGAVRARPHGMPIEELLAHPGRNRNHIKLRLIRGGLKDGVCERCGINEWNGAPVSLELHHVNGDGKDHRLENLELLCPNCHSQTETWGGRNRGRQRA
jgi:hypothetical protein